MSKQVTNAMPTRKLRLSQREKREIKRHEYDQKPIAIQIPGFALGALADKAQEWADKFNESGQDQAAHDWYVVVKALATAANNFNAERPA